MTKAMFLILNLSMVILVVCHKKGSWKAEDNEIFAQLDKKGYSLEDIFTVVDENEDGEISSEEIGKIAALDGKDSISTDDFESLINQIYKADIEGQVDTQEELFELLGVNAQGELPQDSSALKQQIYNMYLSSKDSPEEAFSWANDYKEEKAKIEEFSKIKIFATYSISIMEIIIMLILLH